MKTLIETLRLKSSVNFQIQLAINRSSEIPLAGATALERLSSTNWRRLRPKMGRQYRFKDQVCKYTVAWPSTKAGATREKEADQASEACRRFASRRFSSTKTAN